MEKEKTDVLFGGFVGQALWAWAKQSFLFCSHCPFYTRQARAFDHIKSHLETNEAFELIHMMPATAVRSDSTLGLVVDNIIRAR